MSFLTLESKNHQVDQLLELLCIQLQITDTQYANANRSYQSVGEWLSKEGSALRPFSPTIFVQGSMGLGTTVKPRGREDFDVDLVCQLDLDSDSADPMRVYNAVLARIMAHELYAKKAEPKERCIRINYAVDFHLDIVPACPRPRDGLDALVIPDKAKKIWCPNNPKGYVRWFASRALPLTETRTKALSVAPLPPNMESGDKAVLQRIVQLFKRRRDVKFNGDGKAPRSILLTTLAGMLYNHEEFCTDGVINILDRIGAERWNHAGPPFVPHPTNPKENVARHWQEDPSEYEEFLEFCAEFRVKMHLLTQETNLKRIAGILDDLFDPTVSGVTGRAVKAYLDRFQGARESGVINMRTKGNTGLTTSAAASAIAIPSTTFFGD